MEKTERKNYRSAKLLLDYQKYKIIHAWKECKDPNGDERMESKYMEAAYLVLPRLETTNAVVKIAIAPVEVEHKYQISSFEDYHLILLMFP